jgi:hypothetical protein
MLLSDLKKDSFNYYFITEDGDLEGELFGVKGSSILKSKIVKSQDTEVIWFYGFETLRLPLNTKIRVVNVEFHIIELGH